MCDAVIREWKRGVLLSSRIIDTYQLTSELQLRGYLRSDFRGRVLLTKLRADDLELGAASFRGRGGSLVPACQTCREQGCVESRAHFVLQCAALEPVRRRHPDILKGIRSARPERAMATILLAFPRTAADESHVCEARRPKILTARPPSAWSRHRICPPRLTH